MSPRWAVFGFLLGALGVAACAGTETGNPDLSTGGDAGPPRLDGGPGSIDGGPLPGFDAGDPPQRWDAGWVPSSDGGAADSDGQVPEAPDDDLDAGVR